MLVLSRKQKQQIRIGDDVVVTVLQVKGGSVRIGIEAPREVHVMRGELEDFREPRRESDSPQESTADQGPANILELKFQGNTEGEMAPTRLTEIASAIPSLNLPR